MPGTAPKSLTVIIPLLVLIVDVRPEVASELGSGRLAKNSPNPIEPSSSSSEGGHVQWNVSDNDRPGLKDKDKHPSPLSASFSQDSIAMDHIEWRKGVENDIEQLKRQLEDLKLRLPLASK